jgi:hypothetical protein
MSYKREVGDRSFPVPRTWAEGSWVRSESKQRCTPFWVNIAAISLCAVGVFSILQSGVDMKNFDPWIWTSSQQQNHQQYDKAATTQGLGGLGKQVCLNLSTNRPSVTKRRSIGRARVCRAIETIINVDCGANEDLQTYPSCRLVLTESRGAGGPAGESHERHRGAGRGGAETPDRC